MQTFLVQTTKARQANVFMIEFTVMLKFNECHTVTAESFLPSEVTLSETTLTVNQTTSFFFFFQTAK